MGNDSVVLWWMIVLSVIVVVMRYRTEIKDTFWTPAPGTSNSLFNENPYTYVGKSMGKSAINAATFGVI